MLPTQVSAGGSLANSIVGVARLGLASTGATQSSPLRVGMLSVAGSDAQVRLPLHIDDLSEGNYRTVAGCQKEESTMLLFYSAVL